MIASTDVPTFDNLTRFQVETGIVEKAFDGAQSKSEEAAKAAETMTGKLEAAAKVGEAGRAPQKPKVAAAAVPLPGAVGRALQAADRLLGFFRTDYTVGGVEVTVEDATLVTDVAGRLAKMNFIVYLPKLFSAAALEQAREDIVSRSPDPQVCGLSLQITATSRTLRHHERAARAHVLRSHVASARERRAIPVSLVGAASLPSLD